MEDTFIFHQLQYFALFTFLFGTIFELSTLVFPSKKEWDQFIRFFMVIFCISMIAGISCIVPLSNSKDISFGTMGIWFLISWYGLLMFVFGFMTVELALRKPKPD